MDAKYGCAAEKLSAARRILMAPHPRGEAASYADAFHECMLGLKDIDRDDLDDNARTWMATVERTMDTADIDDPSKRGTWIIKAEMLTVDEMTQYSHAVDELAHWFDRRFWGGG